jgi:hypothetical protein
VTHIYIKPSSNQCSLPHAKRPPHGRLRPNGVTGDVGPGPHASYFFRARSKHAGFVHSVCDSSARRIEAGKGFVMSNAATASRGRVAGLGRPF